MLELPLQLVFVVKYKHKFNQIKDNIAFGESPVLELHLGLVSAVKYKYKYKHLLVLSNTNTNTNTWREPCVGATPRACQCCLLKAIDCDSRLSNYQLISQLSATIITFVIVLVSLVLVLVCLCFLCMLCLLLL